MGIWACGNDVPTLPIITIAPGGREGKLLLAAEILRALAQDVSKPGRSRARPRDFAFGDKYEVPAGRPDYPSVVSLPKRAKTKHPASAAGPRKMETARKQEE